MCGDGQPEPFMGMEEDNIPLKHLLKLQDIFRQLAILDILIFLPVIEPCTNWALSVMAQAAYKNFGGEDLIFPLPFFASQ